MVEIKLKRGNIENKIKGSLAMAPSEYNIPPFRVMLKNFGAFAVFSKEIKYKKDIDFTKEDPFIIAYIKSSKLVKELEANDNVKAICYEFTDKNEFEIIKKATNKPLILSIKPEYKINKTIQKTISGILVNFLENEEETEIDSNEIDRISKETDLPVFVRGRMEKPENIYSILRKTKASVAVLGRLAEIRPVIFDQTNNYFEKGYYNKITRKRREKTIKAFEKALGKVGYEGEDAEKFKQIFTDDSLKY
ncbi:MAG: tRNA-dihydrouridine synthase [Nanobdellota archaeon]